MASYWYNFDSNYWSTVYKHMVGKDYKFKVGYDSEVRLGWASLWVCVFLLSLNCLVEFFECSMSFILSISLIYSTNLCLTASSAFSFFIYSYYTLSAKRHSVATPYIMDAYTILGKWEDFLSTSFVICIHVCLIIGVYVYFHILNKQGYSSSNKISKYLPF